MPLRVSCPSPLPRLACLGGGGPVPVPPYLAWSCAPPVGRVRGVRVPGGRFGGGGCVVPPVCAAGGASRAGGRSASFCPSAFPGQATKRVSLALFWSSGAWSPYHSGLCSPAFSERDLCGVLARWRVLACSRRFLWEPVAGAGGRAVLRLLARAGGGGTIPPASGVGGRRPRGLRAGGGVGERGVAPRPPCSPSGGRPAVRYPGPPLAVGAPPFRRARSVGVAGPPRGGGKRGGPSTTPPGAPLDLNPPSALPDRAMVMGLGPRAAPARWCGLAHRLRPPREQAAGGAGARGVQVQPQPPPPRRGPFWGRGGVPSAPGGRRVAPVALKLGGGAGGGGGGAAPPPPAPPPRRPSACHPLSPARPPGVYSCRGGCRAASGVRRGPVGRQWVSAAGGGGRGGEPPRPGSRPCLPQAGL